MVNRGARRSPVEYSSADDDFIFAQRSECKSYSSIAQALNEAHNSKLFREEGVRAHYLVLVSRADRRSGKKQPVAFTEEMSEMLGRLRKSNFGYADCVSLLNSAFPVRLDMGDIKRECERLKCPVVHVTASAPANVMRFRPQTISDWQWGIEGWKRWTALDLDRPTALYLCRPVRLGVESYGFYTPWPGYSLGTTAYKLLYDELITLDEAVARAMTYFGACADGMPMPLGLVSRG